MKLIKYLMFIVGLTILYSCDNFLDVKPKGYTIPETFEDYNRLMNSLYIYRTSDVYPMYITDDIRLADKNSLPINNFDYVTKGEEAKNLYSFQKGQVFTPGNSDGIWEGAYSNIFTYNAVINNIMSATGASEEEKARLRAEALYGRAFEYLNLVNVYGKHYNESTAATDYGVPILLSEEVGKSYTRNTVKEVYDQIASDLKEAESGLVSAPPYSFRPSKSSLNAFKARLYLYMGDYDNALIYANNALKDYNTLVDYKLYTTKSGTWRRIISIADETVIFPDDMESPENIYTRTLNNTSYLFASIAVSEDLVNLYTKNLVEENAEDMRFKLFFAKDEMNRGGRKETFPGFITYISYIEMNVGFTTAEMYLIAAECEARVGSVDNALSHLNTLRDMRISNNKHYVNIPAKSKEEALKLVIDERRREFAFVGATRLIDIKRLSKESWFIKKIVHSADGNTWEMPTDDSRLIMPIPQNVLSYNPNMPQYDR